MLTQADWASIHRAIQNAVPTPGSHHGTISKVDKDKKQVWIKELGDEPVLVSAYDYELRVIDPDTGKEQKVRLSPVMPDDGDTILVTKAMGSRGLSRATGVVKKAKKKPTKDFIVAPSRGGSKIPIGALVAVGFNISTSGLEKPEDGWLSCNGAAISRSTYSALFDKLGTAYGAGDGSTTFNLPNFIGRTPFGKAASGTLGTLGAAGGVVTHTLSIGEIPAHNHPVSDPGHFHDLPSVGVVASGGATVEAVDLSSGDPRKQLSDFDTGNKTTGITIGNSGSGQSHQNMPPYQVIGGWIIRYK